MFATITVLLAAIETFGDLAVVAALLCFLVAAFYFQIKFDPKYSLSPAERAHGPRNAQMICPHCQAKGTVHTQPVRCKKGISGGKATAAILTGGVSILATGL